MTGTFLIEASYFLFFPSLCLDRFLQIGNAEAGIAIGVVRIVNAHSWLGVAIDISVQ